MHVGLTRIPDDGRPNTCTITLDEGSIVLSGTGGFVTGALRALLAEGSIVRALIFEHIDPEDLGEAWQQAARDAGL